MAQIERMRNFLLIQGPPGTGKTHTIKGIISMLSRSLDPSKKILVCAPSNAAIDEIVTRLVSTGLLGSDAKETSYRTLRIGAMEHEPNKHVQEVLFDTKFAHMQKNYLRDEAKQNEDKQAKWQLHLSLIEDALKVMLRTKFDIKQLENVVLELLDNKDQIRDFMEYTTSRK